MKQVMQSILFEAVEGWAAGMDAASIRTRVENICLRYASLDSSKAITQGIMQGLIRCQGQVTVENLKTQMLKLREERVS